MCAPVQDSAVVIDVLDLHTVLCLQRIENIKSSIQKKCNFIPQMFLSPVWVPHPLWRSTFSLGEGSTPTGDSPVVSITCTPFNIQYFFLLALFQYFFFVFTDPKPTSLSFTVADHFLFLEKAQLPLETREYISVICTPFKIPLYIPLQYSPSIFFFNIPL